VSGHQFVLSFPPSELGLPAALEAVASAMLDGLSPAIVQRLGWDPTYAFGIDPQDYDDPTLPWLNPEELGVARSEDHGYGLRGEPVRVGRRREMLEAAREIASSAGFSGLALVWRWRPGQGELFPDSNHGDPAYVQWNVWRETPSTIGLELMVDSPQSWVPRTAPFGAWLVAFLAGALRSLGAPACAEPERRSGLYAPLDLPALLESLRDGRAFAAEFGRLVAISSTLVGRHELAAGEQRARDEGRDVRVRVVEKAGHFFLLPAWVG
jgi:hypothetical protein